MPAKKEWSELPEMLKAYQDASREYEPIPKNGLDRAVFLGVESFTGKYGDTYRYRFVVDGNDREFSLLSASKALHEVVTSYLLGDDIVTVYKNDEGHWRIVKLVR